MKTCLVVGGNGFIGSHLAEGLVNKGYAVRVFDNFQNGINNLEKIKNKIEVINGDFMAEAEIGRALKDIDYVFHYVSTTVPNTAIKDPIYDIQTNIIGSVKLFHLAALNNVKKVIFSSSGGTVYGEPLNLPILETDPTNPINPYGISKLAIEKYLYYYHYSYGLDYTIMRYSNPYGERQNPNGKQGAIPIFLNMIKNGQQPIIFGDGTMVRDYLYINDAIDATVAIFEKNSNDKIFNIGSGIGFSVNDLVSIMSAVVGKKVVPQYMDGYENYVKKVVLDISRIHSEINWKPGITIEEGIKRTWEWIINP